MEHPEKNLNSDDKSQTGTPAPADNKEFIEKERYDNAEALLTKKSQALVEFARAEVERDPTAIERIPDPKVQKKLLEEKYWVDSIEELKVLFPNALKVNKDKKEEDEDELSQLKEKVALIEYKTSKTKTNEAIDLVIKENQDIADTIEGFEDKLRSELKYLSSDIPAKERAEKALRLVASTPSPENDAYKILIWKTNVKGQKNDSQEIKIEESNLFKAFKNL